MWFSRIYFERCEEPFCKIIQGKETLVGGKTNDELVKETKARKQCLKDLGYDVDGYTGWFQSCRIEKEIKSDLAFMSQFKSFPQNVKPKRLQSENASYSGFLDVLQYLWSKETSENKSFFALDINSLFFYATKSHGNSK